MQVEIFNANPTAFAMMSMKELSSTSANVLLFSSDHLFSRVLRSKALELNINLVVCESLSSFLDCKTKTAFDFAVVDLCSGDVNDVLNVCRKIESLPMVVVANSPRQLRLAEWSSRLAGETAFVERRLGVFRIFEKGIEMSGFCKFFESRKRFG